VSFLILLFITCNTKYRKHQVGIMVYFSFWITHFSWRWNLLNVHPFPPCQLVEVQPLPLTQKAGSLKRNTALEYSTRVVQEGGRRCKKSTLNDLVHLTPLRIPLMNPPREKKWDVTFVAWFDGRGTVESWTRFFVLFLVVLYICTEEESHEGNTEVKNGGYVVVKWNIHRSAGN
jgi:hypothetical protein